MLLRAPVPAGIEITVVIMIKKSGANSRHDKLWV
jgi:hypothetical protein